jgi:hypothetical protein
MKTKRTAVRSTGWVTACMRRRSLCLPAGVVVLATLLAPRGYCQAVPAGQLRVDVVRGEGDVHRPGDKAGTAIEIAVLNEVDLPQPAAECSFAADADGPSVRLEKELAMLNLKRMSGADGKALVEGVFGNKINGPVTIRVFCSFEGKEGRAAINQVNERGAILTRNRVLVITGAMAATGISLYQVYKPGPPSAAINAPTAGSTTPQASIGITPRRFGR